MKEVVITKETSLFDRSQSKFSGDSDLNQLDHLLKGYDRRALPTSQLGKIFKQYSCLLVLLVQI